jgi:hypothetical protein
VAADPNAGRPHVLLVDDEPSERRAFQLGWAESIDVTALDPEEVTEEHLKRADLLLVDYKLDDWQARLGGESIACNPRNGLGLASVLRSHVIGLTTRPVAVALHSGRLDDVESTLPAEYREHAMARLFNLEWVFAKAGATDLPPVLDRVVELASAVSVLPTKWLTGRADEDVPELRTLLAIPDDPGWNWQAVKDVLACHPPIHELAQPSHGLAFLRWLLHRILPYPTFLLGPAYVAARLGINPASLTQSLAISQRLRVELGQYRYRGILSTFVGALWWRTGIEHYIWELTEGQAFETARVHRALSERTGLQFEAAPRDPVVCIDDRFRQLTEVQSTSACVRVQPDDWPPYAEQAWTTTELVAASPQLFSLVLPGDRELLR